MADPDRGPSVDQSFLMEDGVLERELRDALKSEGEIELLKIIQRKFQIENDLANSPIVRQMLSSMWENVIEFFALMTEAPTLVALEPDATLVLQHQRMLANFAVVAGVNAVFKAAKEAEIELRAADDMGHEIEELE
jgi:hypothetical protein